MAKLFDRLYGEAQVALARILENEERQIIRLYGTALYDIRNTLRSIYNKYGKDGVLTNAEMSKYQRLVHLQDNIASILKEKLVEVDDLSHRLAGEQYKAAFYRHAYTIDQVGGMALNWGVVPEGAVEAIVNSPLSKFADSRALALARIKSVDAVRSEIGLAIIRGDSYDKLSGKISDALGVRITADGKRAQFIDKGAAYRSMTVARTEGQRVMVDGQAAAYGTAQEMGCTIEEIWDATLDGRTRPEHGALDGVAKQEQGWYVPSIGWVSAPLHSGVASFDINCRCRIRAQVKGLPPKKRYVRGDGIRPYQTYDQWKAALEARTRTQTAGS